jgi:hypothetical protein
VPVQRDENAVDALTSATLRGASAADRKPLHVAANAFNGVDLDSSIYRIVPVDYFVNDVRERMLTHIQIGKKMWGDAFENPLSKQRFFDSASGTHYGLSGILDQMFGVCWSTNPEEVLDSWDEFSRGLPAVRIQSTPRKLLSEVMNVSNPYFMLHHFVGKIQYSSQTEIESYISKPDVWEYLDSLGHELAFSVMYLRNCVASEQEVRLVYSHSPDGNDWVEKNVKLGDGLCRIPFRWDSIVGGITVGPNVKDGGEAALISALRALGHNFPVWSSSFRRFTG